MHQESLIARLKREYPNQSELARLIGVDRSHINRVFKGTRPLTLEVLRRIRVLPGYARRADLTMRELYLAPIGAPPADSQDTKAVAVS
jgi:transcriptional regulator with XRE-family HTH domain